MVEVLRDALEVHRNSAPDTAGARETARAPTAATLLPSMRP
jgi:hypothetical protein